MQTTKHTNGKGKFSGTDVLSMLTPARRGEVEREIAARQQARQSGREIQWRIPLHAPFHPDHILILVVLVAIPPIQLVLGEEPPHGQNLHPLPRPVLLVLTRD